MNNSKNIFLLLILCCFTLIQSCSLGNESLVHSPKKTQVPYQHKEESHCSYTKVKGIAHVKSIKSNGRVILEFIPGDVEFSLDPKELVNFKSIEKTTEFKAIHRRASTNNDLTCPTHLPEVFLRD